MTLRAWIPLTIALLATLVGNVSTRAGEFHPQGYHPYAAPYPYPYSQGQPASDWTAPPPQSFQDYGNTCCGPHWYDAMVEAVYMTRSGAGLSDTVFTSQGIAGFGPPNAVLSGSQFDFKWDPAIKVSGRIQLNAVTNIEATYLDSLNWRERIGVTSNNHDLYSVFSQFGDIPFGGFEETDQATRHDLMYDTDLDSVEVNLRHAWTTPSYRLNGSWLLGMRYVKYYEQLQYNTLVTPHFDPINQVNRQQASLQYNVFTRNELVGPQLGTELVTCLFPSLMLGGEAKAGVFLNFAEQDTAITSSVQANGINEAAQDDDVALVTEGSVFLIYQFHPLLKLRGGYQVLFMQGLANAMDNFNSQAPFATVPRSVFLDQEGSAFFHGATLGLELGW
jgi:hypothetical protein